MLIIVLIAAISACKKDDIGQTPNMHVYHDLIPFREFRDSMTGTYSCVKHYSFTTFSAGSSMPGQQDTILGIATVTVTKSGDSSLNVNGTTFTYTAINHSYLAPAPNAMNQAIFYSSDSIWFDDIISSGVSHRDYYYYIGQKQ